MRSRSERGPDPGRDRGLPTSQRQRQQLTAYITLAADQHADTEELREFLNQHLPSYMVPGNLVILDCLPRTVNGKIDRRALRALRATGDCPDSSQTIYAAPRNALEEKMTAIWSSVMNVERIGIHDNFFDLGGDSILSIQVAGNARREGMKISTREIFRYPTIATLSENLMRTVDSTYSLPVDVPLTPSQLHSIADLTVDRDCAYVMILESLGALDHDELAGALTAVVNHHDALRLQYLQNKKGWIQRRSGMAPQGAVDFIDLSGLPATELSMQFREIADRLRHRLDISAGILIRLAHIRSSVNDHVVIVVHHLAADLQSMQIIIEDLGTTYTEIQRGNHVTTKTYGSYLQWAMYLQRNEIRDQFSSDKKFSQERRNLPCTLELATDYGDVARNTVGSIGHKIVVVDALATHHLLNVAPVAYPVTPVEILLTSIVKTIGMWLKTETVTIGIESDTRPNVKNQLDLTQTVGNFTSFYPLTVPFIEMCSDNVMLDAVKEAFRRVSDSAFDFLMCTDAANDMSGPRSTTGVDVLFRYLGSTDTQSLVFKTEESVPVLTRNAAELRRYTIEIFAYIKSGKIHVEWVYSDNLHKPETIGNVAAEFERHLTAFIDCCMNTPSDEIAFSTQDFPDTGLSQDELDSFVRQITS